MPFGVSSPFYLAAAAAAAAGCCRMQMNAAGCAGMLGTHLDGLMRY